MKNNKTRQPKEVPETCPTSDQIYAALKVYQNWKLHYYQLLYFQQPKLTEPGKSRGLFSIEYDSEHIGCLKLICNRNPEYSFTIHSYYPDQTQDQYDAEILRKCQLIAQNKKDKTHNTMCCGLAEALGCVCAYAWTCLIHGEKHIGTHD